MKWMEQSYTKLIATTTALSLINPEGILTISDIELYPLSFMNCAGLVTWVVSRKDLDI